MTPKLRAAEFVHEFYEITPDWEIAKQCALIAVNKILKEIEVIPNVRYRFCEEGIWLEIKSEIESL